MVEQTRQLRADDALGQAIVQISREFRAKGCSDFRAILLHRLTTPSIPSGSVTASARIPDDTENAVFRFIKTPEGEFRGSLFSKQQKISAKYKIVDGSSDKGMMSLEAKGIKYSYRRSDEDGWIDDPNMLGLEGLYTSWLETAVYCLGYEDVCSETVQMSLFTDP